jgi:hypothetical protein
MTPTLLTDDELAQEMAAEGEKWLDEHEPEWDKKVEAEDLDMGSWRWCVLGQVYGDFTYRPAEMPDPVTLGFDVGIGGVKHYEPLDRAWQAILAARRA